MSNILLISEHRQFGVTASVWETEQESPKWFELKERLSSENDHLSPLLNDLITLSQTLSDQEIHRRFSRKGILIKDFLKSLALDMLTLQIRPYIDRRIDKMLRIAVQGGIPIFLHEGTPRLYPENQLFPDITPVEPWFCFARKPEGSDYVLELFSGDQKITLKATGNRIICNQPCWFKSGNRLYSFPDGFDGKKIQPFLTRDSILIPASAEKKYFETFIMKTLKTGQVMAEGFTVQKMNPPILAELSLEVDWQGRAALIIYFRYGEKRIMAGKPQKVFIDLKMEQEEVVFYKTERNFEWETTLISQCIKRGLSRFNESMLGLANQSGILNIDLYALVEWINRFSDEIKSMGILVRTDRSPIGFFTGTVVSDFQVLAGEDWFDVKAEVYFGDLKVPFAQLRNHILNGTREFTLPNGEMAVLPAEWFTRYNDLFYYSHTSGDGLIRVPHRHFRLVSGLSAHATGNIRDHLDLLEFHAAQETFQPAELKAIMRTYQQEGLQWMTFLSKRRFGGCLADDMGLGKTIQALALLLSVKPSPHKASMVVMPASLVHNWRNEIRRFAPVIRIMEHTGISRASSPHFFDAVDVILTTYGTVRNDVELFAGYQFHYVILDESQMIKNPSAQVSRAVCQLKAVHRLVLTGTPIENSLTDLWSQMEFLNPGMLGSLAAFQKRYKPEISDQEKKTSDKSDRLRPIIAPFILRRTKREVEPELPPLTIEEVFCEMSDDQRVHYEREKSAVRNEVLQRLETEGAPDASLMLLKALIRLRQAASHPVLVDHGYTGDSGKFEEIIRTAVTLHEEGHKTLIFSSFVRHLQLIAARLQEEEIGYTMLTGSTIHREEVVNKFRGNNVSFFLISLKAGGTGLNLTEAGYVMILDPWWNPAAELQAINRAHRIGQDKKVIAYKFISSGTIEEKILQLQQRKQQLSDDFVPSGNPLKDMSREEIKGLFG